MTPPSLSQSRFGRLHVPDPGDRRFMVAPDPKEAENVVSKYHYTDLVLDQGMTSHCVGAAGRGWLSAGPVRNLSGPDMHQLYAAAQLVDEWPGEEPAYFGTSVRALFKVLKAQGYVSEYRWAFSLEPVINHVLTKGPMVLGTVWLSGQMETDNLGFIHADGNEVGGHAYLIKGANREKKCPDGSRGAFRGVQSWGRQWGQNGLFWLSFKDAAALIANYGEAATATEVRAETKTS
jgi:hypothetical protein